MKTKPTVDVQMLPPAAGESRQILPRGHESLARGCGIRLSFCRITQLMSFSSTSIAIAWRSLDLSPRASKGCQQGQIVGRSPKPSESVPHPPLLDHYYALFIDRFSTSSYIFILLIHTLQFSAIVTIYESLTSTFFLSFSFLRNIGQRRQARLTLHQKPFRNPLCLVSMISESFRVSYPLAFHAYYPIHRPHSRRKKYQKVRGRGELTSSPQWTNLDKNAPIWIRRSPRTLAMVCNTCIMYFLCYT